MELTGAAILVVPPELNHRTIGCLRADLEAALADPGSRAVLLLGGEQLFCSGLDLAGSADASEEQEAISNFAGCLEIIRTGTKPVIALVRGEAVAGGVGL